MNPSSPGAISTSNESAWVQPTAWAKLTSDEKIERMHEIVRSMQLTNSRLSNEIYNLKRKLATHTHSMEGKAVEPITEYDGYSLGLQGGENNSAEAYF